jgi:hypothetical protein
MKVFVTDTMDMGDVKVYSLVKGELCGLNKIETEKCGFQEINRNNKELLRCDARKGLKRRSGC